MKKTFLKWGATIAVILISLPLLPSPKKPGVILAEKTDNYDFYCDWQRELLEKKNNEAPFFNTHHAKASFLHRLGCSVDPRFPDELETSEFLIFPVQESTGEKAGLWM